MSSLRYSITPTIPASSITRTTSASPPAKKQKMSLTQTYYLAHTARGKLSKEAARGDHNLRLLVGHANLLDGLMLDLANAEEEQESWFNSTVKTVSKASEEPKHIQWANTIPEEVFEEEIYEDGSESDSDSDNDEEMLFVPSTPAHKAEHAPPTFSAVQDEDEEMEDDDYEDGLALTRTLSAHPPELLHEDSDSESEDDSLPPSPSQPEIALDAFSEKQRQAIATTSFYQSIPAKDSQSTIPESDDSFFDEGFYLPQRQQTTIVAY